MTYINIFKNILKTQPEIWFWNTCSLQLDQFVVWCSRITNYFIIYEKCLFSKLKLHMAPFTDANRLVWTLLELSWAPRSCRVLCYTSLTQTWRNSCHLDLYALHEISSWLAWQWETVIKVPSGRSVLEWTAPDKWLLKSCRSATGSVCIFQMWNSVVLTTGAAS